MPLRNAPLPRMAGDLTFMRSRRSSLGELSAEHLAILGAPIEKNVGRKNGTRFAPTALRETSVYFGWHANPQFSHPVDIDARVPIDTSAMHGRLVDIGDIALERTPVALATEAILSTMKRLSATGASVILLGGDDSIVPPALAAAAQDGPVAFIQIGGHLPASMPPQRDPEPGHWCSLESLLASGFVAPCTTAIMAGSGRAGLEFVDNFNQAGGQIWSAEDLQRSQPGALECAARTLLDAAGPLYVHFDVSALQPSLHGMSEQPAFGGLTLPDLQKILGEIGRVPVSSLIVTGLNPTLSGLSIVKTGLRLTVTALLAYIYARLDLSAASSRR